MGLAVNKRKFVVNFARMLFLMLRQACAPARRFAGEVAGYCCAQVRGALSSRLELVAKRTQQTLRSLLLRNWNLVEAALGVAGFFGKARLSVFGWGGTAKEICCVGVQRFFWGALQFH